MPTNVDDILLFMCFVFQLLECVRLKCVQLQCVCEFVGILNAFTSISTLTADAWSLSMCV